MNALASSWAQVVQSSVPSSVRRDAPARMTRGRALAKGGKVHQLDVSPGLALADVHDSEIYRVSVRIREFSLKEWDKFVNVLVGELAQVAALFEGEVPAALIERLQASGVRLIPRPDELEGDCDCADHVYPCAHLAAVHHLLAEAIAADPFQLLAMRGRPRDVVLGSLRKAWGGDGGLRRGTPIDVRGEDIYHSPVALEATGFELRPADRPAAGLRALGPLPGDAELVRVLTPLYEAGAKAALAMLLGDVDDVVEVAGPVAPTLASVMAPSPSPKSGVRVPTIDALLAKAVDTKPLGERLVDIIAEKDGLTTSELAALVSASVTEVRTELTGLAAHGILVHAGPARATRWWLG